MSQFLNSSPAPPPPLPVRAINSWSLSAIGTYEKCALKARFKYVNGLQEKRSATASRGVNYHKAVEEFLTGAKGSLPEELSFYTEWLNEVKKYEIYPERKISLTKEWTPEGWDQAWVKAVLDLLVVRRPTASGVQVEGGPGGDTDEQEGLPKESKSTERTEATPTELVIYDWKTGKIYPDHDDQKSLYSLCAFSEYPSVYQVRAIHVYLDLRQLREKTFHRDEMHVLRASWEVRADKYFQATREPDSMIPNPGYHCRYCGYSAANGGPCRF